MMIGKVCLRKSFYGAVNYVMTKKEAQVIAASGVRSVSVALAAKDFEGIRSLRPQVKNAVWHTSISFAYEDKVDNDLMATIANDYMKTMGLNEGQHLIVRHNDQKHAHFHLIANRIKYDGQVVSDRWCKNRTARVCDQLEVKYGLIVARSRQRQQKPTDKVHSLHDKKSFIKETFLEMATKAKPKDFDDMTAYLKKKGIEMQLHIQSTGRINGISFRYDGISFKGSALGSEFKYKKILELLSGIKLSEIPQAKKDEIIQRIKQQRAKPMVMDMVRQVVTDLLKTNTSKSLIEFKAQLKTKNIDLTAKYNSNQRITGLSYCYRGLVLSDRVLGKEFSYKNLLLAFASNEKREPHLIFSGEHISNQPSAKAFAANLKIAASRFFNSSKTKMTFDDFKRELIGKRIEPLIAVRKDGSIYGILFRHENLITGGSVLEGNMKREFLDFFRDDHRKQAHQSTEIEQINRSFLPITDKIAFVETVLEKIKTQQLKIFSELSTCLLGEKIEIQCHLLKSGQIGSLSFIYDGLVIKATMLSQGYSVQSLQRLFEKNQIAELKAADSKIDPANEQLVTEPYLKSESKVGTTSVPDSVLSTTHTEVFEGKETKLEHIQKSLLKICSNQPVKGFEELRTRLVEYKMEFKIIADNRRPRDIIFIHDGFQVKGSEVKPGFSLEMLLKLFNANKALGVQKNNPQTSEGNFSITVGGKVNSEELKVEQSDASDPKLIRVRRLKMKF